MSSDGMVHYEMVAYVDWKIKVGGMAYTPNKKTGLAIAHDGLVVEMWKPTIWGFHVRRQPAQFMNSYTDKNGKIYFKEDPIMP